jgi:toluene monooxygenase system protein D
VSGRAAADVVGPVLESSELGLAVLAAIQALNVGVTVQDRGSYVRVQAARRCVVTRQAIEAALGRPVQLPGDLELAMPSFRGSLKIDAERAVWEAPAS